MTRPVWLPRTDRTVRALDREVRRWEARATRSLGCGASRALSDARDVVAVLQKARLDLVGVPLRPYLVNLTLPGSGIRPPGRPRTRPRRSPGRKETR